MFQPLCQGSVALPIHDALDGEPNGLGWSHQDGQVLGTSQSRVEQVPTEQHIVLHEQGENHDRVFTARIASRKSSFLLFKQTFCHDFALVFPPRSQPRSSAREHEENMAFVREKEEDVS
jgi:hypothetical protein